MDGGKTEKVSPTFISLTFKIPSLMADCGLLLEFYHLQVSWDSAQGRVKEWEQEGKREKVIEGRVWLACNINDSRKMTHCVYQAFLHSAGYRRVSAHFYMELYTHAHTQILSRYIALKHTLRKRDMLLPGMTVSSSWQLGFLIQDVLLFFFSFFFRPTDLTLQQNGVFFSPRQNPLT